MALIYLGATPDVSTLTLSVANLVTNHGQNWELLTAAAFVSMALPLVIFFTLQKYFVRGISGGGRKRIEKNNILKSAMAKITLINVSKKYQQQRAVQDYQP